MNAPTRIRLNYRPRAHFAALHNSTAKRIMVIAHRRAGKTVANINVGIQRCIMENTGKNPKCSRYGGSEWAQYHYIHYNRNEAMRVAWNYFVQYLEPYKKIFAITAKRGVTNPHIDIVGRGVKIRWFFDGVQTLGRGNYSDGMILDEFAFHPPEIWGTVLRHMLADRDGWCIRTTTPSPVPEVYEMFQQAKADPDHLVLELRPDDTSVFNQAQLDFARSEISEEAWQREMELDWMAGTTDLAYGRYLVAAREEERIGQIAYLPALPVHTAWDLGVRDYTSIWFFQVEKNGNIRIIDFEQGQGRGADEYVRLVKSRDYLLGTHLFPHDIANREWASGGQSREKIVEELGLEVTKVAQTRSVSDGVENVRVKFPLMYFDEEKCKDGLVALERYKLNDNTKEGKKHSHAADALRTMIDGLHKIGGGAKIRAIYSDLSTDAGWFLDG